MFSCEIYEIFKKTYFEEHLRTASDSWLFYLAWLSYSYLVFLLEYIRKVVTYLILRFAPYINGHGKGDVAIFFKQELDRGEENLRYDLLILLWNTYRETLRYDYRNIFKVC